jgi:Lon protease-like protein
MMRIPIFPLRKSVRLPTDRLQLNLYEERYIAMSEYILLDDDQKNNNDKSSNEPSARRIFGAIYASNKPQLVRNARGPVVPILSVGDVGTVFYVQESEEGMIPTADSSFTRRRIRLNAMGVGRFRIENILHDGTYLSPQEMTAEDDNRGGPLPFILVEASWIQDNKSSSVNDDASENKRLEALQQEIEQVISQTTNRGAFQYDESGSDEDEKASTLQEINDTTTTSLRQEDMVGLEAVGLVQSLLVQNGFDNDFALQQQEQDDNLEIFSFAAASALGASQHRTAKEMSDVLQMKSTLERLETIASWRTKNGGVFWR